MNFFSGIFVNRLNLFFARSGKILIGDNNLVIYMINITFIMEIKNKSRYKEGGIPISLLPSSSH